VDPSLREELAADARDRVVVIDAMRFWQCGTWVGDLTVRLEDAPPDDGFAALEPIDGVRVFARRGLQGLLTQAEAVLERGFWPRRHRLRIRLEKPECWIDYLDRPARFETPE
jgi:hypothetical protein